MRWSSLRLSFVDLKPDIIDLHFQLLVLLDLPFDPRCDATRLAISDHDFTSLFQAMMLYYKNIERQKIKLWEDQATTVSLGNQVSVLISSR